MLSAPYQLEQHPDYPNVLTVRMEAPTSGWEQWFMLRSDAHHDNSFCNQVLEKKHLDAAQTLNAGILDFGDLFCAMQGKWDKRADMNALRAELRVADYTDALVRYNAEFYRPYAPHWVLLSPGNHETALFSRHQTDLTRRLAETLAAGGSPVKVGTYAGWVRFLFTVHGSRRLSLKLRYTHGYGGGGPVTQDVIQAQRQMAYTDADFLVSGHTHDSWHQTRMREVLTESGRTVLKETECLKCPGYKDEYSCGGGWAVGKGHNPKPQGCWMLRFYVQGSTIAYDVVRAK